MKQAVAGYGGADKRQVQHMVELLLRLTEKVSIDDESDALAIALCHLQHHCYAAAIKGGRPQ